MKNLNDVSRGKVIVKSLMKLLNRATGQQLVINLGEK
jgi:hypothetical protein